MKLKEKITVLEFRLNQIEELLKKDSDDDDEDDELDYEVFRGGCKVKPFVPLEFN